MKCSVCNLIVQSIATVQSLYNTMFEVCRNTPCYKWIVLYRDNLQRNYKKMTLRKITISCKISCEISQKATKCLRYHIAKAALIMTFMCVITRLHCKWLSLLIINQLWIFEFKPIAPLTNPCTFEGEHDMLTPL